MTREIGRRAVGWIARWGFALLVGCGALAGAAAGCATRPPAPIPTYALQAAAVYRCEVGAAVFLFAYGGALILTLAFRNRAFTEIGKGSLKAADIGSGDQGDAIREQGETLEVLTGMVERLQADFRPDDRRGG